MTESLPPGFPIQKSPGQRILGSSPRLIAACHVFHRLPTPRHPPVALCILAFFNTIAKSRLLATSQSYFLSIPMQLSMNRPEGQSGVSLIVSRVVSATPLISAFRLLNSKSASALISFSQSSRRKICRLYQDLRLAHLFAPQGGLSA